MARKKKKHTGVGAINENNSNGWNPQRKDTSSSKHSPMAPSQKEEIVDAESAWSTVLQTMLSQLSDLHKENAEVLTRARRTEELCSSLSEDVTRALSLLTAQNEERKRMENHLKEERDRLANEVAELRQRLPKEKEGTPVSVLDSSVVGMKRADLNVNEFWTCSMCKSSNNSSTKRECEMCGYEEESVAAAAEPVSLTSKLDSEAAVKVPPTTAQEEPSLVSMLLEMGYPRSKVLTAIEAFGGAEGAMPEAVIAWMEDHPDGAQKEDDASARQRLEMERQQEEKEKREAQERAAKRDAKKQAKKEARAKQRAIREAELAEEQRAREADKRARFEAKEAKERAYREAEECEEKEAEQRKREAAASDSPVSIPSSGESSSTPNSPGTKTTPFAATGATDQSSVSGNTLSLQPKPAMTRLSKLGRASPKRKRAVTTLDDTQGCLSQYMYAATLNKVGGKQPAISSIFALLHDKNTIKSARALLSLEDECSKSKKEADAIRREYEALQRNIADLKRVKEEDLENKLNDRIQRIHKSLKFALTRRDQVLKELQKRDGMMKMADEIRHLEGLEKRSNSQEKVLKRLLECKEIIRKAESEEKNAPNRIKEEERSIALEREQIQKEMDLLGDQAEEVHSKLQAKLKTVDKQRSEIEAIKGFGEQEEERFDINGSRDEHGNTFLMVAVQNNDVETARLCLSLGASPTLKNNSEFTAMFFAQYFKLDEMAQLLAQNGGNKAERQVWDALLRTKARVLHPIDWETQLRIAEKAAIPADTKLSIEHQDSEATQSSSSRQRKWDARCFDACLLDHEGTHFRRVVLMEKQEVYNWFLETETAERSSFLRFLDRLQASGGIGQQADRSAPISCHRRFVVGVKRDKQFEVLCAPLEPGGSADAPVATDSYVAFFSPFVESERNGVTNIGVLLWAVTTESKASRYKSLIESAEFRRHKVDVANDRFPAHVDFVLELGRNMHLLDLKGTSIFSGNAMELLIINVDEGQVESLEREDFVPTKRLLQHEQQLQQAIFRSDEKESKDNQGILSKASTHLSTNIFAGAGTGKTLLMIKKVISESADKRILVVSRLARLVSMVKSAVEAERDATNVHFSTYDDLLTVLARRTHPSEETEARMFSAFTQVHFGNTAGTGAASSVSFLRDFVEGFLEEGERNAMKKNLIEPITLWTAFRTIKSSIKCSQTKTPLSEKDYLGLPGSFGLNKVQRTLVYKFYRRYAEWLNFDTFKWDEADRVLYVLKWGFSVFSERDFVSWEERVYQRGEVELLDDDEMPLAPFFYHMCFADEAQDFSALDMALFIRMSSSIRANFLGSDPAQSVELGIRMRVGTVNEVFHACLPQYQKHIQVKNVLQDLQLKTNHRTHARNLEIAKAVRKILARSFGIPAMSNETALVEGAVPEGLSLRSTSDLADSNKFRGGNIVFITPDEMLPDLRAIFLELGVKNDAFGIREAKGLEFPSIALIGFFTYFENLGSSRQWENVIRWLFSSKGITTTESSEKVQGHRLEQCDYILSNPEIEDQAMMLYTAMTRARGHLYFVEVDDQRDKKRNKSKGGLPEFAFRHFKQLRLLKLVNSIDEGEVDMTPQQHKARGVLLVVQAINLSRNFGTTASVKEKFAEAAERFQPDKGNDMHLLDQCNKHLEAILMKRELTEMMRTTFFDQSNGEYDLEGRFADILEFEQSAVKFFRLCANDSFLVDEIQELRALIEDVFYGTPYEIHFDEICAQIRKFES